MSLRLRLALWYGGLTGLIVLLVGLLAYATYSRALYDDLDRNLESAVQHVVGAYTASAASQDLATMLETPILPSVAVRVHGPTAEVLAASANAAQAPPVDPAALLARPAQPAYDTLAQLVPPLAIVDVRPGAFGLATGPDGDRWRLYAIPVAGSAAYVSGAAPLARIDALLEAFRRLVPLLALLASGMTLVAGRLLAGRALQPVATLTQTARDIARSRSFSRRVPVGAPRDELGRLATTFNEMLASLEAAYRTEQRFVADASHELRAPLTAIQANLELLERYPAMPAEERREAVVEASREAQRLGRLVADLLALARADAGNPLRHQPVELDQVLMDVLGEARRLARGQRVEVEMIEPAVVAGDADRLRQLVLILVDNAIRYTPAGGEVRLGLRCHGQEAVATVRDSGIGIPPDDLPRVFERFYRADPARARDPGGTGLGLSIARWVAEQHRGSLALTSQVGRGTTATIRLPLLVL